VPRRHPVRRADHAAVLGVIFLGVGSYLLYDAYEARGRTKPFFMRFLGSWG
jgi:hypothetical protein